VHAVVQRILSGVTERRVPEVVRQRHRLDKILIEPQCTGNATADLRNFQTVRQTRAKKISLMIDENLRFVFKATKRRRVDDAVAVALKLAAQRWPILGMATAT
jgi:hypothetical protein